MNLTETFPLGSRQGKHRRICARRQLTKRVLAMEPLEQRTLLSLGFLQGFALLPGDTPQVGATITLHPVSLVGSDATTTTNTDGYYQFQNVAPGTYQLSESATGYTTTGVTIDSTINSGTPINSNTAIQVTVVDPSSQTIGITKNVDPYTLSSAIFVLNASSTNAVGPGNGFTGTSGDTVQQLDLSVERQPGQRPRDPHALRRPVPLLRIRLLAESQPHPEHNDSDDEHRADRLPLQPLRPVPATGWTGEQYLRSTAPACNWPSGSWNTTAPRTSLRATSKSCLRRSNRLSTLPTSTSPRRSASQRTFTS